MADSVIISSWRTERKSEMVNKKAFFVLFVFIILLISPLAGANTAYDNSINSINQFHPAPEHIPLLTGPYPTPGVQNNSVAVISLPRTPTIYKDMDNGTLTDNHQNSRIKENFTSLLGSLFQSISHLNFLNTRMNGNLSRANKIF
jgi:hypothetical protein